MIKGRSYFEAVGRNGRCGVAGILTGVVALVVFYSRTSVPTIQSSVIQSIPSSNHAWLPPPIGNACHSISGCQHGSDKQTEGRELCYRLRSGRISFLSDWHVALTDFGQVCHCHACRWAAPGGIKHLFPLLHFILHINAIVAVARRPEIMPRKTLSTPHHSISNLDHVTFERWDSTAGAGNFALPHTLELHTAAPHTGEDPKLHAHAEPSERLEPWSPS